MSDSSATSSEFSTEVVKEGIVKYRKGNFRRWRKGFFRLTGNGVLTEVLDTKVLSFFFLLISFGSF